MKFEDAKNRFVQAWGSMGSSWGVPRTMSQIHGLLLIAPEPLSAEDVMSELQISRGNANMNIRALIDWNLVEKVHKPGERKEFFRAEKDIWEVAKRITRERRKRELEPVIKVLNQVESVEEELSPEASEFKKVTEDLGRFVEKADLLMDKLVKADEHWFFSKVVTAVKK